VQLPEQRPEIGYRVAGGRHVDSSAGLAGNRRPLGRHQTTRAHGLQPSLERSNAVPASFRSREISLPNASL
jgi:hypothetical protein